MDGRPVASLFPPRTLSQLPNAPGLIPRPYLEPLPSCCPPVATSLQTTLTSRFVEQDGPRVSFHLRQDKHVLVMGNRCERCLLWMSFGVSESPSPLSR
ncbi:hypothetical protein BaRGS_00007913 [Batillaria attramentaria]|uniref:Uncharacterized protein n=1 Tax=Batillaria attramentaria TaxID=370345 RepID=A0ABD0LPU6_9CAEN